MKKINAFGLMAASILIFSCSVKVKDADVVKELGDGWPAYSDQALSGTVFGQEWHSQTVVARLSSFNAEEIRVYFYSENTANACDSSAISSKPYASVILPANLTATEYKVDLTNLFANPTSIVKNPLVFVSTGVSTNAVAANRTKISITSFDETGFTVSAFADSGVVDGTSSSINGVTHVTDCRKVAPFSVWSELKGSYGLQSFDGQTQDLRPMTIKDDIQSKFYDKASGSYIDAVVFPLIYSISPSSEASYTFGPMDGLGTTQVTTTATSKTYKYAYNGPLNYNNVDITLNLDMTVTVEGTFLFVNYTLEIPGHATKMSHQLTLRKN